MSELGGRFALGTVQLGMKYGIANREGQPNEAIAREIVESAWMEGVRFFDTAAAYGESEAVLGRALSVLPGREEARVISKIKSEDCRNEDTILDGVQSSLERLGIDGLWGLLLHDEDLLGSWDAILPVLVECRRRGWVKHFGVSVYSPGRAVEALHCAQLSAVQIPMNALDRRFLENGFVQSAAERGINVFVRSVLLQGLLLMEAGDLPDRLRYAESEISAFRGFCRTHAIEPLEFALSFVRDRAPDATLVMGAELPRQLGESLSVLRDAPARPQLYKEWESMSPLPRERVVNPAHWPNIGIA